MKRRRLYYALPPPEIGTRIYYLYLEARLPRGFREELAWKAPFITQYWVQPRDVCAADRWLDYLQDLDRLLWYELWTGLPTRYN